MVTSQLKPTTLVSLSLRQSQICTMQRAPQVPKKDRRACQDPAVSLAGATFGYHAKSWMSSQVPSSSKWKTRNKDHYSLTYSITACIFHQEHDEGRISDWRLMLLLQHEQFPTHALLFFTVTQVSKSLKQNWVSSTKIRWAQTQVAIGGYV